MSSQKNRIQKLITFSPQLYAIVKSKADKMGLSFTEYLRHLAVCDAKENEKQIYYVDAETEKRIGQSLKDYQEGRYTLISDEKKLDKYLKSLKKDL